MKSAIIRFDDAWKARAALLLCLLGAVFHHCAGASAADIERPQAVDGNQYTIVAPTYSGSDGNLSFIRLFNTNSSLPSTYRIVVVGSPSGTVYGSTSIEVPANASPQYSLTQILTAAKAGALTGGDDNYSLYLSALDFLASYQHVIYNSGNGFFENLTTCQHSAATVYALLHPLVSNVHTSAIPAYPAKVFFHNYSNLPTTYKATVYDAVTGGTLGSLNFNATPNTTYIFPESYFEQQLKFVPTSTQFHVNIAFETVGGNGLFNALVGQAIFNSVLNANINMSTICRVTANGTQNAGLAAQADADVAADSNPASSVERPQAVNGTPYTVIAPTYTGSDGNQSFVRLFNTNPSKTSSYGVMVIGSPSGVVYGTATIDVPANASPQYPLSDILSMAKAGALTGGDDNYSLYLSNPDFQASFQHVIYNSANKFFENFSICNYASGSKYDAMQPLVANVHTSTIAAYPAKVSLHNFANVPVTYLAKVYDAANGTLIGQLNLNTAANATYVMPESFFEQQLKFTPTSNQFHVNIAFQSTASSGVFTAVVGQSILNTALNGANISMGVICRVHR